MRDDLARRPVAVLDRRLDLGESVGAMGEVELDDALGILQDGPVAGQDGVDAVVDRQERSRRRESR